MKIVCASFYKHFSARKNNEKISSSYIQNLTPKIFPQKSKTGGSRSKVLGSNEIWRQYELSKIRRIYIFEKIILLISLVLV